MNEDEVVKKKKKRQKNSNNLEDESGKWKNFFLTTPWKTARMKKTPSRVSGSELRALALGGFALLGEQWRPDPRLLSFSP